MANKKKKTATTNTGAKSKEQLVIHQIVVQGSPAESDMTWGIGGRLSPLQTMDEQSSFMTCLMIS